MTLRTRLLFLINAIVASVVILVTWTVSSSARRAFAAVEAQRTAAIVAQFRREFDAEGERVTARVERIANSDAIGRLAGDVVRSSRDYGAYVGEAAVLAAAYDVQFLDLVASDGTIVSSAHWPARFGYRHAWISEGSATVRQRAAFLHAVELPRGFDLGFFGVRTLGAGGRSLFVVGGRRLDQAFLKTLVLPPGLRVMLYRNVEPEVAGQQLIDASGEVTSAAPLGPLINRIRQSGRDASETVQWPDGPETIDGIPLTGFRWSRGFDGAASGSRCWESVSARSSATSSRCA